MRGTVSRLVRTSVLLEPGVWEELTRLARLRGVEEERRVSASELVRRGVKRELAQARKGEEGFTYVLP